MSEENWLDPVNEKWAAEFGMQKEEFGVLIEEYLAERLSAMEKMLVERLQEKRVHYKDL